MPTRTEEEKKTEFDLLAWHKKNMQFTTNNSKPATGSVTGKVNIYLYSRKGSKKPTKKTTQTMKKYQNYD